MGEAVGLGVELAIAQADLLVDQGRRIGSALDLLLEELMHTQSLRTGRIGVVPALQQQRALGITSSGRRATGC